MDPKRLGKFIADRRKELGLTQAQLSKKLYVTDKAVSRWERGIGLPDINNIEALAAALDVSLLELMQAQRNDACNISTNEAEILLLDTIRLSKYAQQAYQIYRKCCSDCFFCYSGDDTLRPYLRLENCNFFGRKHNSRAHRLKHTYMAHNHQTVVRNGSLCNIKSGICAAFSHDSIHRYCRRITYS